MTTEGPYDDDPFMTEIREFLDNFEARGWGGLDYATEQLRSRRLGGFRRQERRAELLEPRGDGRRLCEVPDHPRKAKTWKAYRVAKGLAVQVAGRSAHEALEWSRFRGKTRIDPHNIEQIEEAAELIRMGLVNGQSECRP